MKFPRLAFPGLFRLFATLLLSIICLVSSSSISAARDIVLLVEDPLLAPAYTTCPETYWYPFTNDREHTSFLTLNTDDPAHSTNYGEWRPHILQAGYYRVEAYIAAHDPVTWCTGDGRTIDHDTTQARYFIHHGYGLSEHRASQYPLSNGWIDLGEYYFKIGDSGYVSLTDLNNEQEYSTTVSFSAMRFTFTRLTRPQVYLPLMHHTDPGVQPPPDAGVIQAQGFDSCHLPSVSEMQAWWQYSPYDFYALYMGGIHLPALCATATASWVSAVHQQGWSFVPTWVGLQAPCSPYKHKMSSDPAVSYQQGRQEADAASVKAASLGLTNYGLGGTIIYYDLEPYGVPTPECRQPVQAFMNGWVERLDELGNLAGGYGSRNSYPSDWATIAHIPDDVWPASWYANGYDPYASVYGISWLEGLWINHQRIRQYAGEVNNTWGGITLNIDIDVADGMVAMPPQEPLANPVVTLTPSIQDTGWLSAEEGWLISDHHLYLSGTRGESWRDISPSGVQLAYLLTDGQAWAVSSPMEGMMTLYRSSNSGSSWESIAMPLPDEGWWPQQIYFTSSTQGWLVISKMASQALSAGMLMKTSDGGLTWQSYELPTAGKINITSPSEAWVSNEIETYHSPDGGITWKPYQPGSSQLSEAIVPEGSTLYGWQDQSLGWSATSIGACTGEKSTPGFSCQVTNTLWQSLDGGETWEAIPMPTKDTIER